MGIKFHFAGGVGAFGATISSGNAAGAVEENPFTGGGAAADGDKVAAVTEGVSSLAAEPDDLAGVESGVDATDVEADGLVGEAVIFDDGDEVGGEGAGATDAATDGLGLVADDGRSDGGVAGEVGDNHGEGGRAAAAFAVRATRGGGG